MFAVTLTAVTAAILSALGYLVFVLGDAEWTALFWAAFGLGGLAVLLGAVARNEPRGPAAMWFGLVEVGIGFLLLMYGAYLSEPF